MREFFLFLFFSLALNVEGATVQTPDWFKMPMVVPATQKEGHNYMLRVDNHDTDEVFKIIAVTALNDEILFGEYEKDEGCAVFYSPRGGRRICHDEFFLLHADYVRYYRRYVNDVLNKTHVFCEHPVQFQLADAEGNLHTFQPFFDKPGNRAQNNAKLEKFIGTYFVEKDEASYWNHLENRVEEVRKVAQRQMEEPEKHADQWEVLCRMDIDYKNPNRAPAVVRKQQI